MAKKIDDEEMLLARAIAESKEYSAFLRCGPYEKYVERGFADYASARIAADRLEATYSRFGRKALAYAITPQSYPIDCNASRVALAQKIKEQANV
jgi:hypothetical protein